MSNKTINPGNLLPIKLNFRFDNCLLYLIQETTKKDSIDILAFFSDFAHIVAKLGLEKRTGTGIKKKITNYFPETSIPFFMSVEGRPTRKWHGDENFVPSFNCEVSIGFPESTTPFPKEVLDKITDALLERDLLGGTIDLQAFDKPEPSQSKMYTKLIEEILGKQVKRIQTPGFDPDIRGVCRNCKSKPNSNWRPCQCDALLADANYKK